VKGKTKLSCAAASVAALILTLSPTALAAQKGSKPKKETPTGTPVLWREPADIATRDLYLGPGGEALKPDLSSVTFVEEETGGYSVKFRVRDGAGRTWVAKLGNEAQSEAAAVRLLWAAGYMTEINYLAPCLRIKGAPRPRKRVETCGAGGDSFANVRLEARPEGVKRLDEWSWTRNPFDGTKELQGLIVMMALLNNWDLKDANNKILYFPGGEGRRGELRYVISDLGATFGKSGGLFWQLTRSRNKPEDFVNQTFISEVKGGNVFFKYGGKNQKLFDDIIVEEARWLGGWLARLSDRQLDDAFRAANYAPFEVRMLTSAVRARINELNSLSPPVRARRG
jgi:hypothetical protein